ncbi:ImmA/IrrE family metallo-endopeptidase [Clavibacter michiganensis]|uniref:ImmA/IrrE family metallo-endopeptidase n=1 Tax=Clavibacter michiganensis TaxID=28447 RepID=UPI0034648774
MDIAVENPELPLTALRDDPLRAIDDYPQILLRYTDNTITTSCQFHGRYTFRPPTIYVTRSTNRARDNFTVLHEYGHHLQKHTGPWVYQVLTKLTPFDRELLEERVADAFASSVLIPDSLLYASFAGTLSASHLASVHAASSASRHAVLRRAIDLATEPTCLVVTDLDGKVRAAESNSEDFYQPAKDSYQPDLERLSSQAGYGRSVTGYTREGLRYSTGTARSDLRIDTHSDQGGAYYFHVLTPTYRFGSQQWHDEEVECVNAACEEVFRAYPSIRHDSCGGYRCPNCSQCACEPQAAATCPRCFTELSAADMAAGRSEHEDC